MSLLDQRRHVNGTHRLAETIEPATQTDTIYTALTITWYQIGEYEQYVNWDPDDLEAFPNLIRRLMIEIMDEQYGHRKREIWVENIEASLWSNADVMLHVTGQAAAENLQSFCSGTKNRGQTLCLAVGAFNEVCEDGLLIKLN